MATFSEAEHARDTMSRRLRRRRDVTSIAIERTEGEEFGVVVGMRRPKRAAPAPDTVDGVPVRVVVEGPAHPLEADAG